MYVCTFVRVRARAFVRACFFPVCVREKGRGKEGRQEGRKEKRKKAREGEKEGWKEATKKTGKRQHRKEGEIQSIVLTKSV